MTARRISEAGGPLSADPSRGPGEHAGLGSGRETIARAALGTVSAGGIGQAVLIVSGILVARLLGAENRGELALVTLVPTLLAQLGTLGMPSAVTYHVALDPCASRPILRRLFVPALIQVVALALADLVIANVILAGSPSGVRFSAFVATVVVPGMILQQYGLAFLQGLGRFGAFNALRLSTGILYAIAVVGLAAAGEGSVVTIACVWSAAYLVVGVVIASLALAALPEAPPAQDGPQRRDLVLFGSKALFSGTSVVESFRVDQWIVGLFLSRVSLGYYVVASAFTSLPHLLANSLGLVLFPHAAAGSRAGPARPLLRYVCLGIVIAGLLIGLLEALVGRLVPLFFGGEFAAAVAPARILLLGSFFLAAKRLLSDWLRGLGRPVEGTASEIALWLLLVVAAVPLLPRFGVNGAALALTLAAAASFLLLVAMALSTAWQRGIRVVTAQAKAGWRVFAWMLGVEAGIGALLPFVVSASSRTADYVIASSTVAIAALPVLARVLQRRLDIFEPIVLASLTLTVGFGARPIGMIMTRDFAYYNGINIEPLLTKTLWLVLAGSASFVLAYELINRRSLASVAVRAREVNLRLLHGYLGVLSVVGLSVYAAYLASNGGILQVFALILKGRSTQLYSIDTASSEYLDGAPILLACAGLVLVLTHRGRLSFWRKVGVAVLLALPALINASTGGRRFLIPTVVLPILAYYLRRGTRPSRRVLLIMLPITFLFLASIPYVRTASAREQAGGFIPAVIDRAQHPGRVGEVFLLGNDNEMISALAVEVHVLNSPGAFYYGKASVGDMLLAPVPHLLFPSKPTTAHDQMLTTAFGAPCRAVGGVCPDFSMIGTFYQDFWWPGVILGMALAGAVSAAIWRRYRSRRDLESTLLAATWIVFLPITLRAGVWPGLAWFLYFFLPSRLGLALASSRTHGREYPSRLDATT